MSSDRVSPRIPKGDARARNWPMLLPSSSVRENFDAAAGAREPPAAGWLLKRKKMKSREGEFTWFS